MWTADEMLARAIFIAAAAMNTQPAHKKREQARKRKTALKQRKKMKAHRRRNGQA